MRAVYLLGCLLSGALCGVFYVAASEAQSAATWASVVILGIGFALISGITGACADEVMAE